MQPGLSRPTWTSTGDWCERKDRDSPSKGCGEIRPRMFSLVGADPQTCRCRDAVTKSKTRSVPVTVSALKFCTSFVDAATQKFNDLQMQARQPGRPPASAKEFFGFSSELTPEFCKEVLTGTVERSGTWYTDAAVLSCYLSISEHPGTNGFGHLDPLASPAGPGARIHLFRASETWPWDRKHFPFEGGWSDMQMWGSLPEICSQDFQGQHGQALVTGVSAKIETLHRTEKWPAMRYPNSLRLSSPFPPRKSALPMIGLPFPIKPITSRWLSQYPKNIILNRKIESLF